MHCYSALRKDESVLEIALWGPNPAVYYVITAFHRWSCVCDDPWKSAEPFLRRLEDKSDTHLLCEDPVCFVTAAQICIILSHLD